MEGTAARRASSSAWAVLGSSGMQKTLFGLKRAYQATLRFSQQLLSGWGLTAARYDMLHALKTRKDGMAQRHLQDVLGVTRATVSKMLGSLEDLGFVRREIDPTDRRRKIVWLTDEGRARLESAYENIVRPGWVQFALCATLGTGGNIDLPVPKHCDEQMAELGGHLWSLRRGFGDRGSLSYRR